MAPLEHRGYSKHRAAPPGSRSLMNTKKTKGFSVERLLNDPMAMFGALGVMGALVVTVWVAAGSGQAKEEDAGGASSFQGAASRAGVSAKPAREVGSSLKVAKLKGAGSARAAGEESLRDSHGSASAGSDGILRGTLADIEASEKAKAADAAKAVQAPASGAGKKAIPVETAGGAHVPGAAPDSTKLAAIGKSNFGPAGSLSNTDFAGGIGTGGGAAPVAAFAEGNPAAPELGEGGPLIAAHASAPGKATVGGSRQFQRGTAGASAGPAGAGAARRAAGGIGAGAGGGAAGSTSGPGTDFSAGGTAFAPGGAGGGSSGGSSASAEAHELVASAGGGAPKAPGAGGTAGLRGGLGSDAPSSGASSQRSVSQAGKTELKQQARKHYDLAQSYRSGVVIPLTQREMRHAAAMAAKLQQASGILGALDRQLGVEANFFKGYPAAVGPLANTRALIAGGGESLKRRVDSARADMIEGGERVEWVPDKCDFKPTVHDKVWNAWNGDQEDWQWRRGNKGQPLTVHNGQNGYWEDVPRQIDIHGVATSGQDLLEGAARRAANVRQESEAGIKMVDPEFNPAIEAVSAANAAAGARLNSVAGRVKDDLRRVAALLPERVNETVAAEAANQGKLQQAALRGHEDIKALARTVNERRLGYPDGVARDQLDRNMADAARTSGEALGAVNALSGNSSDTMFVLTESARGATSALQSLCYSRDRLTDLAAKAK